MLEATLRVQTGRFYAEIPIREKYTFIRGESGTGKSTLIRNLDSPDCEIDYPLEVIPLVETKLEKDILTYITRVILNRDPCLLYCDEDLSLLRHTEFQAAMVKSKCQFLIVSRYPMAGVPCSQRDIIKLEEHGGRHYGVPYYDSFDKFPSR